MPNKLKTIELRTSPHIRAVSNVETIMRHVVYALLPIVCFAIYQFGISALALIVTVLLSCLLTERFFAWSSNTSNTLGDFSAVITGLLLALTLPPGFPLWMGAVAGFIAIALGKILFGGLGLNVFNPALVGRAFVQAAFPVAITSWTPAFVEGRFLNFVPSTLTWPFLTPPTIDNWVKSISHDSFTGATPLALQKFEGVTTDTFSMLSGLSAGSVGETSALLIIICGAYLAFRRMLDWRIPVAILGSAALTTWLIQLIGGDTYPGAEFMLFSGGLMLGAIFMATDPIGSPVTPIGVWIYGGIIGLITIVIREFGGLTEGVMYAILLGNALAPLIDSLTQPRAYGSQKADT